jgi:hypothetical protein
VFSLLRSTVGRQLCYHQTLRDFCRHCGGSGQAYSAVLGQGMRQGEVACIFIQCSGSGSVLVMVSWILIRIGYSVLDPDPYWECGSGSGSRSMEIGQRVNLIFSLLPVPTYVVVDMCFDLLEYPFQVYFSCKNLIFCDFKV